MSGPQGLILAAGRGSRLGAHTESRPKGLVELAGRPLIRWQCAALADAGVGPTTIVTGYRHEQIEALGLPTLHNARWADTNMIGSLLCALDKLEPPLIVSYSDIVYEAETVRRLVEAEGDLVLTYDTAWLSQWQRRFDDPLSDAETFRVDASGRILQIGGRAAGIAEIQGQFMGLYKLGAAAIGWIRAMIATEPALEKTLDTTSLLSRLIAAGKPVTGVAVQGGWFEVDTERDLQAASMLVAEGRLLAGARRP